MNKIKVIVTAVALLAAIGIAQAQTNLPNFFQSAEAYATTFRTNGVWTNVVLEVAVGADYQNGLQWANDLEVQYDITGSSYSALNSMGLGYRMRNAGIAGVIEMNEVKLEYTAVSYMDTRVEASIYVGYDQQYSCAVIEPEVDIRKKLTPNTFAGIYISEPFRVKKHVNNGYVPNIGIETGFTF